MNQVNLNSNKILNFKATQQEQMQQNPQMRVEQRPVNIPLPKIYNIPQQKNHRESFKETLKKVDIMGMFYPWLEHPILMLGTFCGLSWGIDKFAQSCGGNYESSLVGKAAKLGDNIQESKFVQSKPFQTIWGWGDSIKKGFKKVFKNSDAAHAVAKTPSQAELKFVKDELLTMEQRVIHDFTHVTDTLLSPENKDGSKFVEIGKLGVDKTEKEFVKKFFNGASFTEEMMSNTIQLKRLGLTDDAIREIISKPEATELVRAKYFEKLGVDEEFLNKLKENPATKEDIAKVREACSKNRNIRINPGHQSWSGPIQPFSRKLGLDEVGNRLISMQDPALGGEVKTKTGKLLSTFIQKCHRGFTFGGGKIGLLLFITPMLVETMIDVKKADKKEKAGTAAHGLIHSISWVFTFPLALSLMHRFGGMKYAGMSPEDVKLYREKLAAFNEKADPYCKEKSMGRWFKNLFGFGTKKPADQTFQSYEEYKKAKDALKEELKTLQNKNSKNQTFLTKICKQAAKFLTIDLEKPRSYRNGSYFANLARRLPSFGRNIIGVPLRIGIWAGLTMGVLDGIINKGIKGCFGDHYDRMKDEEHAENKKVQKEFLKNDLHSRLVEAQRDKVLGLPAQIEPQKADSEIINDEYQAILAEKIKAKMNLNDEEKAYLKNTSELANKDNSMNSSYKTEANKTETSVATTPVPEPFVQELKTNETTNIKPDEINSENINNINTEEKIAAIETTPLQEKVSPTISEQPATTNIAQPEQKPVNVTEPIVTDPNSEPSNIPEVVEKVQDNYTYIPSSDPVKIKPKTTNKRDNYTYIPSSENVIKKDKENPNGLNKYIPSQRGAQFNKSFDNSGLESALKRADRAEQKALETLAGKFGPY